MKCIRIPQFPLRKVRFISHINIPPRFLFLSKQGTRDPSQIIVSPGQKIKRGQVIGKPSSKNSQVLHSSIGGTVKKIRHFYFPGEKENVRSVEIKTGGEFSTFQHTEKQQTMTETFQKEFVLNKLKGSGIYDIDVGMLYDYLFMKFNNTEVSHLVINAIEFSPFHILEEKILELHMKEICQVVQIILNIFQQEEQTMHTILNTNSIANYIKYVLLSKKTSGKTPSWNSMNTVCMKEGFAIHDLQDNYTLITRNLTKKIAKKTSRNKTKITNNFHIQNNAIFIKPSTLLALYELLMFDKPQLDIYIQMMIGIDNIIIQKAPIGSPLLYLLSPHNSAWKKSPQHCFFDGFLSRKSIFSFSTPITKNHRYFYFLEDTDFSALCKRLNKWVFYNNIE